jgi:uncharacterized repeat protein (TIGR01451 family)
MQRFAMRTVIVLISVAALLSLTLLIVNVPAHQPAAARSIEGAAAPSSIARTAGFTPSLELISGGFTLPTYVTGPADGSGRLFVLEQAGRIRVISNSVLLDRPYLDISNTVSFGHSDSELGLLGMAFDPDFAFNGTFYLDYTDLAGNTNIERFVVAAPAADVAAVITATKILTIEQPYEQHKGGALQFGPRDGYLYIGMGDGGGGGDPQRNGQNLNTLLAKLLRINVRQVPTYTIPPTNPFTRTSGAKPEIWAYGLRNPWRFSFDRANGDLYIGDVGQHCYEEIDYQPGASRGGENYGWNSMEGSHGFDPANFDACDQPILTPPTLTLPVLEYSHDGLLAAVVGGYVYRGARYPQAAGLYFYADHELGVIWSLEQSSPGSWVSTQRLDISPQDISSFGEGPDGELYLATYGTGEVYHVVMGPLPPNLAASTKAASTLSPRRGEVLTYTVVLRNAGAPFTNTVRVTDIVPSAVNYVSGSFTATLGAIDPSAAPALKWAGRLSGTQVVTLTYAVTVSTITTITNNAVIDPEFTAAFTRSVTIVASRTPVYLPLVSKNR